MFTKVLAHIMFTKVLAQLGLNGKNMSENCRHMDYGGGSQRKNRLK